MGLARRTSRRSAPGPPQEIDRPALGNEKRLRGRYSRHRALFSRPRSASVESDRARKREQIALNTAGGPFMYVGLKICHLAKAHALFAKVRSEHLSRMPDCTA